MYRFTKKCAALSAAFLLCSMSVPAQSAASVNQQQKTSVTAQAEDPQNPVIKGYPSQNAAVSTEPRGIGIWPVIRMILVLALVIGCIYLVVWFMKKNLKPGADNDPFLRKVSSVTLSPGKTVQIVTLLDNAYIIGVTDNAVNLIGRVNDKELVNAMNLYADKTGKTKKPRSFNDILAIFMPNGPKSEPAASAGGTSPKNTEDTMKRSSSQGLFSDEADAAEALLKKQAERINGGDVK